MTMRERLSEWLDVRESEFRILALAVVGAFLVMGYSVLAGALRDAFYLGLFDASTLPYVLYASLLFSLPAVAAFSKQLARRSPQTVMRYVIGTAAGGLLLVYALVVTPVPLLADRPASVAFYLWTLVSALLVTSGFWIVVSEVFAVREAKRLFGLISAGGAVGALVSGLSLSLLLARLRPVHMVPVLVLFLLLALAVVEALPRDRLGRTRREPEDRAQRARSRIRELTSNRHLQLVAGIVILTSAASYVVSWQLQEAIQITATGEAARAGLAADEALTAVNTRIASFMGAFRGWTGGLAFIIQVFLASRILAGAGIGRSLSALPLALLFGSTGVLVAPGLLAATLVRGADNTLGKSLHRTVMELLWVPVPAAVRRRAKAFVDSIADNLGEGLGALLVLAWVTFGGLPSRFLSAFVIGAALLLLVAARAMGNQYFATLRSRLEHSGSGGVVDDTGPTRADRLAATLTRIDITRVLATTGVFEATASRDTEPPRRSPAEEEGRVLTPSEALRTGDQGRIGRALSGPASWDRSDVPYLIPHLARDAWLEGAVRGLASVGPAAVPWLRDALTDETSDFVIRRRIPRVLARIEGEDADRTLLDALNAARFEVRYRVALALYRRRLHSMAEAPGNWRSEVWDAIRTQLGREKPVWELARLLDGEADDDFVEQRVGVRGELSLEHTFRLLSLVLEHDTVRAAYHGIIGADPELRSLALEYLEQALPEDVRDRLWPFIGDLSEAASRKSRRALDDVVADLLQTGATLFGTLEEREALRRYLDGERADSNDGHEPGGPR